LLHNVTTKSLYDQRRSLLAWAVSLVLLVAMYVAIWPSVRDQPAMTDFLNSMPPAMRSLFAMSGADMTTPIGYVKIEMLSLMAPLLVLLYAGRRGRRRSRVRKTGTPWTCCWPIRSAAGGCCWRSWPR